MKNAASNSSLENFKTKVFISYSRTDSIFVDRLGTALKQQGIKPSIDRTDIYPTQDWQKRLHELIEQSDTIIFVLSPAAIASESCITEVEFAASLNKRFVPIVCHRVSAKAVPKPLSQLQFIFFDDPLRFQESVNQLTEALLTDIEWTGKHTEFIQAARRWDKSGRPRGRLLARASLNDALKWIETRPQGAPPPAELIQIYFKESRKARRRNQNIITGVSTVGFAGALVLAIWALWERGLAQQSFSTVQSAADDVTIKLARQIRDIDGIKQDVILLVLPTIEDISNKLTAIDQYNNDLLFSKSILYYEFAKTYWYVGDINNAELYIEKTLSLTTYLLSKNFDSNLRLKYLEQRRADFMQQGDILRVIGKLDPSIDSFENAKADCQEILKLTPNNMSAWGQLTDALGRIGDAKRSSRQFDQAFVFYKEAERIQLDSIEKKINVDYWRNLLSWSYNRIGDNLMKIANHEGLITISDTKQPALDSSEALSYYKKSLEIRRSLFENDHNNTVVKRNLVWALALNGMALLSVDTKQAWNVLEEALGEVNDLLQADGTRKNTESLRYRSLTRNFRGDALFLDGRLREAFIEYEEALSDRRELVSIDPQNARWKRDLFYTLFRIFEMHRIAGNENEARRYRRVSLEAADEALRYFRNDEVLALVASQLKDHQTERFGE